MLEIFRRPHCPPESCLPDAGEAILNDPARREEISVGIREAFPRRYRLQTGWLQRRRLVLRHGEIGNTDHADVSARPRLGACPLDEIVDILALLVRHERANPAGRASATHVGVDHGIALPHPPHRVGRLPTGLARERNRHRLAHDAVLRTETPPEFRPFGKVVLAIRMRRQQHGERPIALGVGAVDVHAEHDPITDRHGDISVLDQVGRRPGHSDRWVENPAKTGASIRSGSGPVPGAVKCGRHPGHYYSKRSAIQFG